MSDLLRACYVYGVFFGLLAAVWMLADWDATAARMVREAALESRHVTVKIQPEPVMDHHAAADAREVW
jgi:hypothetical protein